MAAVNPSLYADSFAQARSPPHVFTAVSTRLGVQRALTADLAAFLHERTLVEEHYIRSLEKLGARLHSQQKDALFREQGQLALSQRDQDRTLGQQWATLRRTIEADLAETARVHDRWRTKVDKDVAQPLRDSLAKADWARWNQQEQNLAAQVKEYDQLVDKVQKAQQKSTKSGKSASSKQLQSQSALASLGSSLTSALPAFLSQSQQLDLAHGALLKQHLVLCGTHTSDLGRDRMEAGERLLNQVLAVDEGAEAQEWALREGQRLGGGAAGPGAGSQLATVGEFGESQGVNGGGAPRADSLLDRDDAASTVSGATGVSRSRAMSRPTASSTAPPPAVPLPLPTAADADTRSVRSSSNSKPTSKLGSKFSAILGGGSSSSSSGSKRDRSSSIPNSAKYANFAGSGAGGADAPPVPPVQQQQQPSFTRRETDASSLSGIGGDLLGGRSNAGALAPPLQPGSRDKRKSLMPGSGSGSSGAAGGLFRRASRANTLQDDEGAYAQQQQQAQYAQGPMSAEPLGGAGAGAGSGGAPRVDAEGYTLPPDGYDRAIGDSGAGAGAGARSASRNLMDEDDEDDLPLSSSVPKLSIAPSPLPPSSPTMPQEDEQARLAALESVKSALGAPAAGLGRRTTTNRGRRGTDPASAAASSAQRNTLYAPGERQDSTLSSVSATSEDDTPLAQVAEKHRRAPPPPPPAARAVSPSGARPVSSYVASPTTAGGESPFGGSSSAVSAANAVVAPPLASPTGSSSGFGAGAFSPTAAPGRTMSVLSATSSLGGASALGSSGPRPDPFAASTAPGLRASVTETVSALLKGGEVTRALVTGEVALSHRSASAPASAPGEEVQLRVTGLDGAEKVAPNAAFLHAASAGGAAGEYALAASFAATTGGATTPVLKYALSPSASSVVPPLSVKPTWRVEPGLARAIVAYAPLASSPLVGQGAGAQLDDVRIELHLASGTISSFQAKPAAQMLPSGKGIVFSLPAGAALTEGKLLASLVTVAEGGAPAQPGNVAVHWVVRGATAGRVGVERAQGGELDEVRRESTSGKYLAA